jgi:hypothetical protein
MAVGREGGREGRRADTDKRRPRQACKRSTRSDVHLLWNTFSIEKACSIQEGAPAQTCTNICVGIDMCVCVCVCARV